MSELLAIGVSHKTAPVEVRERVALPEARAAVFVRDLRGTGEVHEAVAISTCNRTERELGELRRDVELRRQQELGDSDQGSEREREPVA